MNLKKENLLKKEAIEYMYHMNMSNANIEDIEIVNISYSPLHTDNDSYPLELIDEIKFKYKDIILFKRIKNNETYWSYKKDSL